MTDISRQRDVPSVKGKMDQIHQQQKPQKSIIETYAKSKKKTVIVSATGPEGELPLLPHSHDPAQQNQLLEHQQLEEHLKQYSQEKRHRSHSATSINMTADIVFLSKAFSQAQQDVIHASSQLERLRSLLREKDMEMVRYKHENMVLKQIERRQQKEIEQFEVQAQDAPRVIRALRDELSHAKQKVKVYFAQIGEDSRQIRQIDEERRRLREHNARLEKLIASKDLAERDTLSNQLVEVNEKMGLLEKNALDSARKAEVTEKNLSNDNRQLRGKIHALERENMLIHDRVQKLEDAIREKEKVIASLSIYRYNALNRGQCKVCLKREKEEQELKRRADIVSKLPSLEPVSVKVLSGSSASVSVPIPAKLYSVGQEGSEGEAERFFDKIVLQYSSDASFSSDNVTSHPIPVDEGAFSTTNTVTIDGLQYGTYYFFRLLAAYKDIEGPPSKAETVLIDQVPEAPGQPTAFIQQIPTTSVQISFPLVAKSNICSEVERYRAYCSSTKDFSRPFLVADVGVSEARKTEDGLLHLEYADPPVCVSMYFTIVAVNKMGEGPMSEPSSEVVLDYPPSQPARPQIKRLSSRSIQIYCACPRRLGSAVTSFLLIQYKVDPSLTAESESQESQLVQMKETVVFPTSQKSQGMLYAMTHTVDELEPGVVYHFRSQASNAAGDSIMSPLSDQVDIDEMVPAPGPFSVLVVTSDSFELQLPSLSTIKKPKILGYKIRWSLSPEMRGNVGYSGLIPATQSFFSVDGDKDGVVDGEVYYVSVCLVGEHEEGMYSDPVYVPLCAAIPLPPSPEIAETTSAQEPVTNSTTNLTKAGSKGSNLSLNQRIVNMHHGVPAHHEPPVAPVGATGARGSGNLIYRRSNESLQRRSFSRPTVVTNDTEPSSTATGTKKPVPANGKTTLRRSYGSMNAIAMSSSSNLNPNGNASKVKTGGVSIASSASVTQLNTSGGRGSAGQRSKLVQKV